MLRRTLATYPAIMVLGLLSSVTGDEGLPGNLGYDSLPFFFSTVREKCLEQPDLLPCHYWDSLQNAITNSDSSYKPKQFELAPENKTTWKDVLEDSSQEDNSLETTDADSENRLHKRFTVFRRKSPAARGYKRGPGFRSWGGKRDSVTAENPEKKSKFVSWGGKRDGESSFEDIASGVAEKRPKFQNWGGKRSTDDFSELGNFEKRGPIWKDRSYYLSEPFKKHVPKRPQFQSWGGKRASYPWHNIYDYFHPQVRLLLNGGEKRKFSSWGGKRYDEGENQHEDAYGRESGDEIFKRYVFQNWGGKRAPSEESESSEKLKERDKRDTDRTLQISNLNSRAEEEGNSRR